MQKDSFFKRASAVCVCLLKREFLKIQQRGEMKTDGKWSKNAFELKICKAEISDQRPEF